MNLNSPLLLICSGLLLFGCPETSGSSTPEDVDEDVDEEVDEDADGDGSVAGVDCDDTDADVHPGAEERCNGIDDDCDGQVDGQDAVDATDWYLDGDGDGYGEGLASRACEGASGQVDQDGDCDNTDAAINPGAREICDVAGVDENCDGVANPDCLLGSQDVVAATAWIDGTSDDLSTGWVLGGDWTGDGVTDILVRSIYSDLGGDSSGALWVMSGADMSDGAHQTGEASALLIGDNPYSDEGSNATYALADAGDLNGDGYDDLLIGSYIEDISHHVGIAWAVEGPLSGTKSLSKADIIFTGNGSSDIFGTRLAGLGDIDGDSLDDVGISEMFYEPSGEGNWGAVYLYSHPSNGTLSTSDRLARIEGEKEASNLGSALAGKADLNGDGHADLLIGARYYKDSTDDRVGALYVFDGPIAGDLSAADADQKITGTSTSDGSFPGNYVGAQDVDEDGTPDLLLYATLEDEIVGGATMAEAGAIWLVSGVDVSGLTSETSISSLPATQILGDEAGLHVGMPFDAGDVNGDGSLDLAFSTTGTALGSVRMVYGPINIPMTAYASDADLIITPATTGTSLYALPGSAFDINADGFSDLLLSSPDNDEGGSSAGRTYLLLGR